MLSEIIRRWGQVRLGFNSLNGQPQPAGDHETLDLARALPDLEDLGVAVEAADGRLVDEAIAAEDLGGVPRRGDRRLGGIQLGHRRSLLEGTARVSSPRRVV